MRALAMDGWDVGDILGAVLSVAAVGSITITLAFLALRGRVS
jgi:hypothetical protein